MGFDLQLPRLAMPVSSHTYPYEPSVASSAASSSSSVFSADSALSQTSALSSVSTQLSQDFEVPHVESNFSSFRRTSSFCSRPAIASLNIDTANQSQQRQHPRRSSASGCHRPPPLVRQCDRKLNFVDSLVDSATQIVEVIWPLSVPSCREGANSRSGLSLRTFIQETLRRSRSSYSTLQVALYYLVLIKPKVPKHDFTMEQPEDTQSLRALQCGRRMFLAALILASKYLQDRNFSARAWSKISGLKVCEINTNEMAFLEAVNWRLHVVDSVFEKWRDIVLHYTPSPYPPRSPPSPGGLLSSDWKTVIPLLTPELDRIPLPPVTPSAYLTPELGSPCVSQFFPIGLPSRDSTPTPQGPPRFLEPKPDVIPPTPSVPRIAPLPTPQMTPQSATSCTPSASAFAAGTGRSAMCAAMMQAQNVTAARTTLDTWNVSYRPQAPDRTGGFNSVGGHFLNRRSSLAPSVSSLASSPESMVSDNSSRSSRASSISSVSSAAFPPSNARLARLATCRNVKLPYAANVYHPRESVTIEARCQAIPEPPSSPELENLALSDSVSSLQARAPEYARKVVVNPQPKSASPKRSTCRSRKRGRSSVDLGLQKNVRDLLSVSPSLAPLRQVTSCPTGSSVSSDRSVAQSFAIQSSDRYRSRSSYGLDKALQTPPSVSDGRLAVQKDLGRKRACCAEEAVFNLRKAGPGMWSGIL